MVSITTWTRLEPRVRGDDLAPSLEARVHDAAWLLGRQWQLGEFAGEDAGTPVRVELELQPEPIVALRAGGVDAAFDPRVPLDAVVGAEPRGAPTLAERAEAGVELLDLLAEAGCSAAGIAALVGEARLPAAAGRRFGSDGEPLLALAAGRLPDGGALAPAIEAIAAAGAVPPALAVPPADAAAVVTAARAWVAWRTALVRAAPAPAWVPEQLEHQFALAVAPPQRPAYTLAAPSWDGDALDWYELEVDVRVAPPAQPAGAQPLPRLPGTDAADGAIRRQGVPTPLVYPGMPAPRWWEFEDARVNLAQIAAEPEDLARMLVVEFASVYGNDWYLWPLKLPVGAVHRITRFEARTTFGDRIDVRAAGAAPGGTGSGEWQLFRPALRQADGSEAAGDGLVLLPTLASALDGEVFEEVRYLRDELANLAWAVEAQVRGEDGLPFDRLAEAAAGGAMPDAGRTDAPGSEAAPLHWVFATDVPPHWFALAPDPSGAPRFERLVLRRVDADGTPHPMLPAGELLPADRRWVWQEEVPREGARATRRHRMARGDDGRLQVWAGRRIEVGRGEGSSGLHYDAALPDEAEGGP